MPRNLQHPHGLRRIRAIVANQQKLERDLVAAIDLARAGGHSWREIGVAMGLSHQGARSWYQRKHSEYSKSPPRV